MAEQNSKQTIDASNDELIARFRNSFDGDGYIAVSAPKGDRYRNYKYALIKVIRFTSDGDAIARGVSDKSGGFFIVQPDILTPIHEIPPQDLRKRHVLYWPDRIDGGMKAVMRRIKLNTSPAFPPVPQQPEQGMTGIETPETTDNLQGAEQ